MSRYHDYAPVRETCPLINKVIDFINNIDSENIPNDIVDTMEEIRNANLALRNWGNELFRENDDLKGELDDKINEIDLLNEELNNLKNNE